MSPEDGYNWKSLSLRALVPLFIFSLNVKFAICLLAQVKKPENNNDNNSKSENKKNKKQHEDVFFIRSANLVICHDLYFGGIAFGALLLISSSNFTDALHQIFKVLLVLNVTPSP